MSKLLKIREVAHILNVHPETLRRWDNGGILSAVRLGDRRDRRWRVEDVIKYMEER